MSAATMTQQVEALIDWAYREAGRTGLRQRVEAVRMPNGRGWYYQTRDTGGWPYRLKIGPDIGPLSSRPRGT
jgi:hypothetical protein